MTVLVWLISLFSVEVTRSEMTQSLLYKSLLGSTTIQS
jgi:hypothetical protein